jgi:hypothetical protein
MRVYRATDYSTELAGGTLWSDRSHCLLRMIAELGSSLTDIQGGSLPEPDHCRSIAGANPNHCRWATGIIQALLSPCLGMGPAEVPEGLPRP